MKKNLAFYVSIPLKSGHHVIAEENAGNPQVDTVSIPLKSGHHVILAKSETGAIDLLSQSP